LGDDPKFGIDVDNLFWNDPKKSIAVAVDSPMTLKKVLTWIIFFEMTLKKVLTWLRIFQ
jgi:hypothetical protein